MNGPVPARIFKLMIVLAAVFGVMEARLAWVQLGGGGRSENAAAGLSKQAYLQHSDPLELDSGRGQFVDREGRPLSGKTIRALAAYPTGGDAARHGRSVAGAGGYAWGKRRASRRLARRDSRAARMENGEVG
ncbi:hypothetical protein OMP38_21435 [Cohnella ginsengisoli]|uniref:Uncharacterized protein n=1 Tax=Cohnella ginsengisoli TaxID=425004 RepID=A0A9X4QNS5_9BACL|nr:hypothetical protein [Cohnella ginsengisoli]MDG0793128.1 hypothetical protein [Cohnella ginsengisoli]